MWRICGADTTFHPPFLMHVQKLLTDPICLHLIEYLHTTIEHGTLTDYYYIVTVSIWEAALLHFHLSYSIITLLKQTPPLLSTFSTRLQLMTPALQRIFIKHESKRHRPECMVLHYSARFGDFQKFKNIGKQ